jgi:hypothetical protein
MRRLTIGPLIADREDPAATRRHRLEIYLEPRDLWIGVFVAPSAVYVCPLPCLVFRWQQ